MDSNFFLSRVFDVVESCEKNCIPKFLGFLTSQEASIANDALKKRNIRYSFFGGYDEAERVFLACLPEWCDDAVFPITPITFSFRKEDELSHRDFLGSVLGLGIKRETIGDIIIKNNAGYIFCLDTVADYIKENLKKVRHTSVKCQIVTEIPDEVNPEVQENIIIIASERLDAIIAEVYNLSRSESNNLFTSKKVFINGKLTENNSHKIKVDDTISVRGFGRFNFMGVLQETRKGKLRAKVEVF